MRLRGGMARGAVGRGWAVERLNIPLQMQKNYEDNESFLPATYKRKETTAD